VGVLPTDTAGDGNSAGNLKPVCFINTGTNASTVMAWTYIPLNTESPAMPSNASTVVSPGGNTSACLSLPMGTYTWCYHWELGDVNGDGMIEYSHALDERPVILDQSDSNDLSFAETVGLAAPADFGAVPGICGLDISEFVVEQQHADTISGSAINMGHDRDYVVLRGPITVVYWYIHGATEIGPGVATEKTPPVMVTIPAGETHKFELVDGREDHPGDWNMYIWLVSVDG
jgi:hypothetical protein